MRKVTDENGEIFLIVDMDIESKYKETLAPTNRLDGVGVRGGGKRMEARRQGVGVGVASEV